MEDQQVWGLMSTWIFVFFLLAGCSAMDSPKLLLESTVFVAFAGEDVDLRCELKVPANQSDVLTCFDPVHKPIYGCPIHNNASQPQKFQPTLKLKNVNLSGEYCCSYKTARVYLYLRVRSKEESKGDLHLNYTEFSVVGSFTAVLLVFSVVGSVYVFRGSWSDCLTESGEHARKQKQKREERKEGEKKEDNVEVITAPSTSFYASLEPRPRSIYDVLDQSAFRGESDRSKAKSRETEAQTKQHRQEGVIECVYENF
ncbi:NFAT activation molecule 1 isoform 1-T2 [Spinachia spinachia]